MFVIEWINLFVCYR